MRRRSFLKGLASLAAVPSLAWARLDPLEAPKVLASTLTEAHLQRIIEKCWKAGGDPDVLLCAPWQKQVISGFTGQTYGWEWHPKRGTASIPVYLSDFGEHRVTDDPENADRTAFETLDIRRMQG